METIPADLKPGEVVWSPGAAPEGPIVVIVSLGEQRGYVYRNAVQIGFTTVSTGKTRYETPTGVFVVLQKDKDHRSKTCNNAPMPCTQRLTWSGVALHAGGLPGYPSSHGCVHLPSKFAEELFADREFRLEQERSRHGPVSLVMSRARREIREPEAPLGTHAYVLTSDYLDAPHPWASQVPMGKWLAVAVPGHFDEAGRALSTDAAARIQMPEGFARAAR